MGLPSGARAQLSGMDLPSFRARAILPLATVLVAMSSTRSGYLPEGTATVRGLVPNMALAPPKGATRAGELQMLKPIMPSAAACMA